MRFYIIWSNLCMNTLLKLKVFLILSRCKIILILIINILLFDIKAHVILKLWIQILLRMIIIVKLYFHWRFSWRLFVIINIMIVIISILEITPILNHFILLRSWNLNSSMSLLLFGPHGRFSVLSVQNLVTINLLYYPLRWLSSSISFIPLSTFLYIVWISVLILKIASALTVGKIVKWENLISASVRSTFAYLYLEFCNIHANLVFKKVNFINDSFIHNFPH